MTGIEKAAAEYLGRCRRAGDDRPAELLLREIVDAELAYQLAAALEWLWVI